MTETPMGAAPGAPLTAASQARLAEATAAMNAALAARRIVVDGSAGTGAAIQLLDLAEHVLHYAVLADRAEGATWQQIGDAFGITRQSAQARWASAEQTWTAAVRRTAARSGPGADLAGVNDADGALARLEAWLAADASASGHQPALRDRLVRLTAHEELALLADVRQRRDDDDAFPLHDLAAIYHREAEVYDALATFDPSHESSWRAKAAAARHFAQGLDELSTSN